MQDEIKEILDFLTKIVKENKESDVSLNSCVVPFETLYKLQDCITNLQEKVKLLTTGLEATDKAYKDYKSRNEIARNHIMAYYYTDLYDDTLTAFEDELLNILNGGDKDA